MIDWFIVWVNCVCVVIECCDCKELPILETPRTTKKQHHLSMTPLAFLLKHAYVLEIINKLYWIFK